MPEPDAVIWPSAESVKDTPGDAMKIHVGDKPMADGCEWGTKNSKAAAFRSETKLR